MPKDLECSTPDQEGVLQVSKARKLPCLFSANEMERLLEDLGEVFLFDGSRPLPIEEAEIPTGDFLKEYRRYVEGIQCGALVDEAALRPFFSAFLSCSIEALYAMPLQGGKCLVKARRPVIQMKRHHFIFSEGAFHSGVMGRASVSWGIEFSYPQLSLDPKSQEIRKVEKNGVFPNTELFHKLIRFVRDNTKPTPFIVGGERINQPIRLGKECFEWINNHPMLKETGLYVGRKKDSQISDR